MQNLFVVLSNWKSNEIVIDLFEKVREIWLKVQDLIFNVASFILNNYSHNFLVLWVKALFDILQTYYGFLSLIFIIRQHLNIVHFFNLVLDLLIKLGEISLNFIQYILFYIRYFALDCASEGVHSRIDLYYFFVVLITWV